MVEFIEKVSLEVNDNGCVVSLTSGVSVLSDSIEVSSRDDGDGIRIGVIVVDDVWRFVLSDD